MYTLKPRLFRTHLSEVLVHLQWTKLPYETLKKYHFTELRITTVYSLYALQTVLHVK